MRPPPSREHVLEFDLLRGAAIIAVVYLHAYFTPWPEASRDGVTLLHVAHLFAHGAVPVFLFVAAYLQASGPDESPLQHLRHRWSSVLLPVTLWMVAALVYRLMTEGDSSAVWKDLALFNISGQFYFVWLLLVFGVVLTQARRVPASAIPWLVSVAFVVNLATIAFYQSHASIDGLFAQLAYRNPFAWIFFPVLGYAMGRYGVARVSARVAAAAALGMLGVAAVYLFRGVRFDDYPVSYFGVTVFLFSSCGMFVYPFVATWLLNVRPVARPLLGLSRYAFPIFLVHLPFAMGFGTRELLGNGADWNNYWLLLHANAFVGLFVSLALVRELDKANPRLGQLILGIRSHATARRRRAVHTRASHPASTN